MIAERLNDSKSTARKEALDGTGPALILISFHELADLFR
jgi:hypothetical protein